MEFKVLNINACRSERKPIMTGNLDSSIAPISRDHVPESQFGLWFLSTEIWATHVLERAIRDLERLIADRKPHAPEIVDIGCGWGRSFKFLAERFAPRSMIGIDIDDKMLEQSAARVARDGVSAVTFRHGSGSCLPLVDNAVDMVLCHQTFHHLVDQEAAILEFYRVLRPGGMLLFAESTKRYIYSWIIRLLFRHPMEVQKTADEYLTIIRSAGFVVAPADISYPYLWWSREDLGLGERWFRIAPRREREETLVNLIAVKPLVST